MNVLLFLEVLDVEISSHHSHDSHSYNSVSISIPSLLPLPASFSFRYIKHQKKATPNQKNIHELQAKPMQPKQNIDTNTKNKPLPPMPRSYSVGSLSSINPEKRKRQSRQSDLLPTLRDSVIDGDDGSSIVSLHDPNHNPPVMVS